MTKAERKALRKQVKSKHTLLKHEGIETSSTPSKHLFVANAGLGNGVSRDDVDSIFNWFGEIADIVMLPEKPYAFVEYTSVDAAVAACQAMHGRKLKCPEEISTPGITFYISFMEKVPPPISIGSALPPGLIYLEEFIIEEEEQDFLEFFKTQDADCADTQKTLKHRKVKHYGFEFIYGPNNVDLEKPLEGGIPTVCDGLLDKLMAKGYIQQRPDQLTINQYEPGQGIPPHVDTHSPFEDGLISLSLGSQAVMDFRHPDGRHLPVVLQPRSVIIMTGESRYLWTHGITPRKADVVSASSTEGSQDSLTLVSRGVRTSFTFRKTRSGPCQCKFPEQCDSQKKSSQENILLPKSEQEAAQLENKHVHEVYEEIAGHFSGTRHTPWPRVVEFLTSLPDGALLADIGCGNGKYLGINKNIFSIGCDRSFNLVKICEERGHEVFVCDALSVPLRDGVVDACISIAVVHHMSTQERRQHAIQEVLRVLHPGGKALFYVWALEQELHKVKSNYLKEIKMKQRGQQSDSEVENNETVVVENGSQVVQKVSGPDTQGVGTLAGCCQENRSQTSTKTAAGQESRDSSVNESNSSEKPHQVKVGEMNCRTESGAISQKILVVHVNRTKFEQPDLLVPWHLKEKEKRDQTTVGDSKLFHRYYHVFEEGELEVLCQKIPKVRIVESYYDKGNWCAILMKENDA
ncbi:alkylated DNA repair protein alkB homolog 8 [Lingula anatina]|uniref:tRNA (carboxymethyluridine(34)-5-O)-methyltransferase n=1 Tax=Lingula anatina TaxID=7574 RepID=A0A1S3KBY1_LINAN|nr:alkylated DNA repair protein alkB homolog 8 [Lingula anatina]|eukprot:XP_013420002.2 alkylated DNA repair protein alkB homolog 8 [Lingula anatina]